MRIPRVNLPFPVLDIWQLASSTSKQYATSYILCMIDIHIYHDTAVRILTYPPPPPTHITSRIQLEIPRLQRPKHPLGIILATNLQQPRPVRLPVPFKHPLPLARVVLVDESVRRTLGFGGGDAAVDDAGGEGEDAGVGGGVGPGCGEVEDFGWV